MKKVNEKKKKKGFTLIELIVVIAILGVLAAIAVPKFSGLQQESKLNVDKANAKIIANAAEVLLAQDKIKVTTTASKDIVVVSGGDEKSEQETLVSYLKTVPVPQSNTEVKSFTCSISNTGVITVKIGTETIYPETEPKTEP